MANNPLNTELLDRAIIFAVKAHAGTERRGKGFPYIVHPMEAMEIVATITPDQEMLAAAAQKYLESYQLGNLPCKQDYLRVTAEDYRPGSYSGDYSFLD